MTAPIADRPPHRWALPWTNPIAGFKSLLHHDPRWAGLFLVVLLIGFVIFQQVTIFTTKPVNWGTITLAGLGDIDNQREFGRRFLHHEWIYEGGSCFNYMPISAMFWAPMALVPEGAALTLRFAFALWCTWFIFYAMARMIRREGSVRPWDHVTCVALTVLLGIHFVMRDMTDGGLHLIHVAMIVAGVYCAWLQRQKLAGAWLGLAIATKMTPGLFLPFLVWKRQWRLLTYTSIATVLWIALPALYMGPTAWWKAQMYWNMTGVNFFADKFDPMRDGNELVVNNQTLKLLVHRFCVTYPPGHKLRLDHPADVPVLNLSEQAANRVYYVVVLGILGAFAWWTRKPYRGFDDRRWLVESAGVILLALIFSPVIGMRHAVFAVPALYLLVVHAQGFRRLDRTTLVMLGLYLVLTVLLNRSMLGKPLYMVLLSFKLHMVAFLLILAMFLRVRPIISVPTPVEQMQEDRGEPPQQRAA